MHGSDLISMKKKICNLNRSARCAATEFYEFSMNFVCIEKTESVYFIHLFPLLLLFLSLANTKCIEAEVWRSGSAVRQSSARSSAFIQCKFIRFVLLIYLNRIRNSRSRTSRPRVVHSLQLSSEARRWCVLLVVLRGPHHNKTHITFDAMCEMHSDHRVLSKSQPNNIMQSFHIEADDELKQTLLKEIFSFPILLSNILSRRCRDATMQRCND